MKRPFTEAILFIILLMLNTLTAFIYNIGNEIWQMIPIRLGAAFINGVGVSLIMTLGIHYIRKFIHLNLAPFIIGLIWFIVVVESFLLFNFYTLITPSCILVLFETNNQEASEFITSYFDFPTLFTLAGILSISFLTFRFRYKIYSIRFPEWSHQKKFLIPFCIFTLIGYAALTYYITQVRHMTSYQALTGVERIYHSLQSTVKDRREYQKYMKMVQHTSPVIIQNQSTVPYIVVILGESLSKWHMSAYGYSLPTTPKLEKRIENGETYRFDSIIAAKTITAEAIQRIMTFFDDESSLPWYQYHTLPSVMKAAGYKTYWLSNQDSFNTGDDNSTAGIISTSSVIKFTHQRHASEERYGYFDGDLLPLLDEQLQTFPSKAFICFHLMGSHRRYTNRYPTNFTRFKSNDIKKNISPDKKQTIAEYDNSVLYNDYVVDEIIQRFEKKNAVIICFPDHGEEVYDMRNMSGHGLTNPTPPMYKIPFTIWTSAIFKQNHPELEMNIQASTQKSFNTAGLIHLILNITGIKTTDYQQEKSLLQH